MHSQVWTLVRIASSLMSPQRESGGMWTPDAELGKKVEGELVYITSQACPSGVLMSNGTDDDSRGRAIGMKR